MLIPVTLAVVDAAVLGDDRLRHALRRAVGRQGDRARAVVGSDALPATQVKDTVTDAAYQPVGDVTASLETVALMIGVLPQGATSEDPAKSSSPL